MMKKRKEEPQSTRTYIKFVQKRQQRLSEIGKASEKQRKRLEEELNSEKPFIDGGQSEI